MLGLLIIQSTSSFVLNQYEDLLRDHIVVTLFLTMLVGAGGNAGNQSAIKVIRALVSPLSSVLQSVKKRCWGGQARGLSGNQHVIKVIRTLVSLCLSCEWLLLGLASHMVVRQPECHQGHPRAGKFEMVPLVFKRWRCMGCLANRAPLRSFKRW